MHQVNNELEAATAEFKNVVSDQVAEFCIIDPTTGQEVHGTRPWIRVSNLPENASINDTFDIKYNHNTNQIMSLTHSKPHNKTTQILS